MLRSRFGAIVAVATLSATSAMAIYGPPPPPPPPPAAVAKDWPMFGGSVANTSNAVAETAISVKNVAQLKQKWVATTGGDVSARAAVVAGVVYFPDWGGNIWALNGKTGKAIWHHQLSDFGLPAKTVSRTSPAVVNGVVYIGSQTDATLLAINAATGKLKWKTRADPHPQATVTGSPAVTGGVVYVGMSSQEEFTAFSAAYKCCSFRGSVLALSATTGKILWKTFTAPEGYTGVGVWGSNPIVDVKRKLVYIGTGNNHTKPTDPAYAKCIAAGGTEPKCLSPVDYVDSMLALDTATGKVKWSKRLQSDDDWNAACLDVPVGKSCPKGPVGLDYDFGPAPNTISATAIGAGQKNGVYTAFNPDTGAILWASNVGPGSDLGGMEWGTATDGNRVYVAISNFYKDKYVSGTAGSWAALDAKNGKILWQVKDPNSTIDLGPMGVSNGVVYAGSMSTAKTQSNMFALDAATGKVLWKFNSGASVNAGAVVSGGVVYWGSGYNHLGISDFTGNNKFYAFSIGGK
jgi:polyvinyl alcohol dehydrogenase (cytochrome)